MLVPPFAVLELIADASPPYARGGGCEFHGCSPHLCILGHFKLLYSHTMALLIEREDCGTGHSAMGEWAQDGAGDA